MVSTDLFTAPRQRPKSRSEGSTSSSSPTAATRGRRLISAHSSSPAATSVRSIDSLESPSAWETSKHRRRLLYPTRHLWTRKLFRLLAVILFLSLAFLLLRHHPARSLLPTPPPDWQEDARIREVLRPMSHERKQRHEHDPTAWLKKYSNNAFAVNTRTGKNRRRHVRPFNPRPRAALISLVRNEELEGILQSMRQLEQHWNHKYQYPWIFFNERPFSDEFKAATSNITSAATFYVTVPKSHWSTPRWIDQNRYMDSLDYLGTIGVGKGWMLSYRNMCRWNSGFFYKHPALKDYDFYWRVEPDVHFFCDIDYDPFRFMRDNELIYGFNMNILEDARSFPSLWSTTVDFITAHPELIHPNADLDWLVNPTAGGDYNNCQFFSNFEIGDLSFFRSEANEKYFEWLDKGGGFYYERFGDAPIHTLSVSMFAPKDKTWFFRDIGYQHDIARHCPPNSAERCACEPTSLDENFYKLVPMESPQKKPDDTCIRQWLGGEWLDKKEGWSQEAERIFGGDGYGGYVREL